MVRALLLLLLGLVLFGVESAAVAAKPVVTLKLSAFVVGLDPQHKETLVPLTRNALPGQHIRWQIVETNAGDRAARNVTATGTIVRTTTYVANSAAGDGVRVEFSLDDAKTWSANPQIRVKNGTGTALVKADVSTYTAVRWSNPAPLAPGASRRYRYDVLVR